jgi:hypothetical protein
MGRIWGITEAEQVSLLLVQLAQLGHAELGAVVMPSIGSVIRWSTTLLQFRGAS